MKESKHTSGKWKLSSDYSMTKTRSVIYTDDIDNPDFEIIHNERHLSESSANAKLILAAPDLLEVLHLLVISGDFDNISTGMKGMIITAIKKATK